MMHARFRSVPVLVLAAAFAAGAAPARAADDLSRQLIDQCVGCRFPKDLHGRDLHGLRFVGSDLRNVDFSRSDLRDARFTGADLDGAKFNDADLRGARFDGVSLRGTSFAGAKLDGVKMTGIDFVRMPDSAMIQREVHRAMQHLHDRGFPPVPPVPSVPPVPAAPPAPPAPPEDAAR